MDCGGRNLRSVYARRYLTMLKLDITTQKTYWSNRAKDLANRPTFAKLMDFLTDRLVTKHTPLEELRVQNVTIYDAQKDEFYPVDEIRVIQKGEPNADVLDEGHIYLVIKSV